MVPVVRVVRVADSPVTRAGSRRAAANRGWLSERARDSSAAARRKAAANREATSDSRSVEADRHRLLAKARDPGTAVAPMAVVVAEWRASGTKGADTRAAADSPAADSPAAGSRVEGIRAAIGNQAVGIQTEGTPAESTPAGGNQVVRIPVVGIQAAAGSCPLRNRLLARDSRRRRLKPMPAHPFEQRAARCRSLLCEP